MKTCAVTTALAIVVAIMPAAAHAEKTAPPVTGTLSPSPLASGLVDPSSLAVAREILATAFPPEKREQMYASMMDSLIEQTRQSMDTSKFTNDKEFEALLDRSTQRMFDALKAAISAALPDYFESMAHAYARRFSLDELNAILAFAKTPVGQHYFAESANILKDADVQAAGRRMSAQLMAKLPEITRQSTQDVEDYMAKKEKQSPEPAHTS